MLRLLLILILALIVARIVWRVLAGVFEAMAQQPGHGRRSVGLVRDPVCGTYVVPSQALSSGSGTSTHYFCSEKCRAEFGRSRG